MEQFLKSGLKRTVALGIIVILVISLCALMSTQESSYIENPDLPQYFDDLTWFYAEENATVTLPHKVSGKAYDKMTLTKVLPEISNDNVTMMLNSCNSIIQVYLDNTLIYDFGVDETTSSSRMVGDFLCIVPLDKSYSGKTIKIVYTPVIAYDGSIPMIYFRYYDEQFLYILERNMFYIGILFGLLIFAILAIGTGLIFRKNALYKNETLIINFLLFVISVGIWIWANSDLPQLCTQFSEMICLTTYLSVSFATVPLLGIFIELLPDRKRPLEILQLCGICIVLINIIGYVLGIILPSSINLLTQLLYAAMVLYLLIPCFRYKKNHAKMMPYLNLGYGLFVIIGLAGIIAGIKNPTSNLNVKLISISVLLFSAAINLEIIETLTQRLKESTTTTTMERASYIDPLTSLANRSAMYKFADELQEKPANTTVTVISVSISNLRAVNEQSGHTAGDILLQNAAEVIYNAYKNDGNVFKIDGNDFETIILNSSKNDGELRDKLLNAISIHNITSPYRIEINVGIATAELIGDSEVFFGGLLEKAQNSRS